MKNVYLVLAFALALLSACSKYNTDINQLPSWHSDWILPLVKGKVSFENIKALSDSKMSFAVPSLDIGYASGINLSIPPVSISSVGPYKQALSGWIHQVGFDSLQIKLTFTNEFPIPIAAGTKFSFRRTANTTDPANVIYQHTLNADIAPQQVYSFDIKVVNNFVSDTLYQYLEQFASPGGNNVMFSGTPSKMEVEVKVIDINRVELFTDKSVTEKDTVDINFENEDTGTDTGSYGKVNLFVDNAIPVNFSIQVYFLDPLTSQVKDSLLNNAFNAPGCSTNAAGDPANIHQAKTSISITTARINEIKKSKRAILSYRINTIGYPPPLVILNDKTNLKIQITGDLHLGFNLNSL